MNRTALFLAAVVALLPGTASAFAPVALTHFDPADDSLWTSLNELSEVRLGWDATTLTYEIDYTIESNAVITLISANVPFGETDFLSTNGYGGAFPSAVTSVLAIDHLSGFWGCNDLFVFDVDDGSTTDITQTPGVIAWRSAVTCDGSAGYTHVEIDWDVLCGTTPGEVPNGLQLGITSFIRATDDSAPADHAPDQGTLGTIDSYYWVIVDGDHDGFPDGSWPGDTIEDIGPQTDADGDGLTAAEGDCDDNDPNVHPYASEDCGNGLDDDCNGLVDGADPECTGDDDSGDDDVGDDDTSGDDDSGDDDVGDDDVGDDDSGDDDDVGDDDSGDDDVGDDDTSSDDDTGPPDGGTTTGCSCGSPGFPEMALLPFPVLLLALGLRRRMGTPG